jgi:hypothetical protein
MIYISIPYSGANTQQRYDIVKAYFLELAQHGIVAVSPVLMGHPFATELTNYEYWYKLSDELVSVCTEVHVLTVVGSEGWRQSRGVQAEIDKAVELQIPVYRIEPVHPFRGWGSITNNVDEV